MPSAEIITIGTELLLGETADTNTLHIARVLRDLGIDLYKTTIIGDNASRIAETIRESLNRADIIITTGGLGPTVDDPTREAVSLALNLRSVFRDDIWLDIVERVHKFGKTPSDNQKRQAYIPEGAVPIYNPVGTAPGFIIKTGQNSIITLPGVPVEMETLLKDSVIPYLKSEYKLSEIIKVRILHTAGAGESIIDELIGDFEELSNPTVGLAAHYGIVDVRITAKAISEFDADQMISDVEELIREKLGNLIYGYDQVTLESVILNALAKQGLNLVIVESGFDGMFLERLHNSHNEAFVMGVKLSDATIDSIKFELNRLIKEFNAFAGLGLIANNKKDYLSIVAYLKSPDQELIEEFFYGGHPKNFPQWGINTSLNWLRKKLNL